MEQHSASMGVQQVQDEIKHYRERYHQEKLAAENRKKELDAMEAKGATLRRTLLHDDGKLLQMQVLIEKEREKMQAHIQKRYWLLAQAEDAQAEVEGMMSEKQELVRKKRDLKDQVQHLEDKQKEILASKSAKNINGPAKKGKR